MAYFPHPHTIPRYSTLLNPITQCLHRGPLSRPANNYTHQPIAIATGPIAAHVGHAPPLHPGYATNANRPQQPAITDQPLGPIYLRTCTYLTPATLSSAN